MFGHLAPYQTYPKIEQVHSIPIPSVEKSPLSGALCEGL